MWRKGIFKSMLDRTSELFNSRFRVPKFEYIVVGPKSYLLSRGKYGKLHAGELLWVPKQAFFLPKASPIYVRIICKNSYDV